MSVPTCYICDNDPLTNAADLADGDYCPICHKPTCRRHLAVVRFRWRENRQVDSTHICQNCKRSYQHRYWDTARRDWIS